MNRPFYRSISGRFKIMITLLILALGIGISTFCYHIFYTNMQETAYRNTETQLQFLSEKINANTTSILSFSENCRNNPDIINFLLISKNDPSYNHVTSAATVRFSNAYNNNAAQAYMQRSIIGSLHKSDFLQNVNGSYSIDRPMSQLVKDLPYFSLYQNYNPISQYQFQLTDSSFPSYTRQMVPLIQMIEYPYNSDYLGYIYTEISSALFTDSIHDYETQEKSTVLLTIGEHTYSLAGDGTLEELTDYDPDAKEASGIFNFSDTTLSTIRMDGKTQTVISRPLSINGCYVREILSTQLSQQLFHRYTIVILVIIGFILLNGILIISIFSRMLLQPLKQINQHVDAIAHGDFTQDSSIEWDNELGDAGRAINQMGASINNLMKTQLAAERQKKDYEYKMLQSQINPHFLYNTLNSIKWMATAQNATGIAEMATSLSRLLKNISKGRSTIVSIQDEIELLDNYFTIQRYRYGGTITMEYRVDDPAIRQNKILRFTLQPIVENAIFHGIEPSGNTGHIVIHMYYSQLQGHACTRIDITDDGVGLEPEAIRQILQEEESSYRSDFFKKMGVQSVNKMLQYTFGEEYGITIASEPGIYTTVSIYLPAETCQEGGFPTK